MKKIIYIISLFVAFSIQAQNNDDHTDSDKLTFAKGTSLVNAGLFFNSRKTESPGTNVPEEKQFTIGIRSSYAYAIGDNLFLGLGIGYAYRNTDRELVVSPAQEVKLNSFNIFPYLRYYKGVGKCLSIFGQGEILFSNEKEEVNGLETAKIQRVFVGIRPGITFMLSKNVALETTIGAIGYTSQNTESPQNNIESDSNEFGISLDFDDLVFGLSYYF